MKAYGGSPPPFDQPGLVALLKSKTVVDCDRGGEGGEGGDGDDGLVIDGGGESGEGAGDRGGSTAKRTGNHCSESVVVCVRSECFVRSKRGPRRPEPSAGKPSAEVVSERSCSVGRLPTSAGV